MFWKRNRSHDLIDLAQSDSEFLRLEAEQRYMSVLRRELANIILNREPGRYLKVYDRLFSFERRVQDDPTNFKSQLLSLCEKYPQFGEFDILGTRDFVPYDEAVDWLTTDDLIERYEDIVKFSILRCQLDRDWPNNGPVTSDEEREIAAKSIRDFCNDKDKIRIDQALELYFAAETLEDRLFDLDPKYSPEPYRDKSIEVIRLYDPNSPESIYGVRFFEDNSYFVTTFFYWDDPEKAPSRSYFRCDENFGNRVGM